MRLIKYNFSGFAKNWNLFRIVLIEEEEENGIVFQIPIHSILSMSKDIGDSACQDKKSTTKSLVD